jgi:hypothetical protein
MFEEYVPVVETNKGNFTPVHHKESGNTTRPEIITCSAKQAVIVTQEITE